VTAEREAMSKEQIIAMMEQSKSREEWDANCDKVKREFRAATGKDYPDWWYEIIMSGLVTRVSESWETHDEP
jgi:hypothetical protein